MADLRPGRPVDTIGAQIPERHEVAPKARRKTRKPPGRDVTLTPEIADLICKARARGVSWADAAHFAEVHPATLSQWRQKAEAGKQPYADLLAKADQADARAIVQLAEHVQRGAAKDWRAAAWLLERRRPEQFGPKATERVEVSGQIDVKDTDPARAALFEALVREKTARLEAMRRSETGDAGDAPGA